MITKLINSIPTPIRETLRIFFKIMGCVGIITTMILIIAFPIPILITIILLLLLIFSVIINTQESKTNEVHSSSENVKQAPEKDIEEAETEEESIVKPKIKIGTRRFQTNASVISTPPLSSADPLFDKGRVE